MLLLPLIVLVGPTAVGKTEISIQLAERIHAEVISADSRLFYRGMDIGTAKPGPEDRSRVPHHLIDVADLDETWSLADFQKAAYKTIDDILGRGRVPLMVGGTGQYVRAVTQGWIIPPQAPDPRLRIAIEKWQGDIGAKRLHTGLAAIDPDAAAGIDYRNTRRTVRALEVIFRTGKRFSEQRSLSPPPYKILTLGLTRPRPELYARIDARIEAMFAAGWVEEVQNLLARGYPSDLPAFSAIGYREIIRLINGELSHEDAVRLIQRNSRQYVRRQANWFKPDDPDILWIEMGAGTLEALVHQSLNFLARED